MSERLFNTNPPPKKKKLIPPKQISGYAPAKQHKNEYSATECYLEFTGVTCYGG